MKRADVTAILLGTLAFAFFIPYVILFFSVIALVLNRSSNGIAAGTGGFGYAFSLRRIVFLLALIVCLPILVSWIGRKISRTRGQL